MAGAMIKTALQGLDVGSLVGDAINVVGAVGDYNYAREQGNSKPVSVAKAAGSFVFGEMVFGGASGAINSAATKAFGAGKLATAAGIAGNIGVMAAYIGVTAGTQLVSATGQHTAKTMSNAYRNKGKLGSGYFEMTQPGYTMRQRSLNAIRSNGLNTQSVLGNEARTYYRGAI